MSIAIAPSSAVPALQKTSPVEAAPAIRGDQDRRQHADANDGAATKPASATQPASNNLGQLLGSRLNVTA